MPLCGNWNELIVVWKEHASCMCLQGEHQGAARCLCRNTTAVIDGRLVEPYNVEYGVRSLKLNVTLAVLHTRFYERPNNYIHRHARACSCSHSRERRGKPPAPPRSL